MEKQLHSHQLQQQDKTIKNNEQELDVIKGKLDNLKAYSTQLEIKLKEQSVANSTSHYSNKHLFTCISRHQLDNSQIQSDLGHGAFGKCLLKFYRNIPAAVKFLHEGSYNDVLTEANVIKHLEGHPNLPLLFGISLKMGQEKYIVTKFHGINLQALSQHSALYKHILEERELLNICLGLNDNYGTVNSGGE